MPWHKLLQGERERKAWCIIERISEDLKKPPPLWVRNGASRESMEALELSLGLGQAGIAVFYAYLARHTGNREFLELSCSQFEDVVQRTAFADFTPTLYTGFPGVGWGVRHCMRLLQNGPGVELADEIDGAILSWLQRGNPGQSYDLINGVVGLGVYALDIAPKRSIRTEILRHIYSLLQQTKIPHGRGVAWVGKPVKVKGGFRQRLPGGDVWDLDEPGIMLGMAHGLAGVIAFLASAATELDENTLEETVDLAVLALFDSKLKAPTYASFPVIARSGPALPSRLAWCHGDLGIALAVLRAARTFHNPLWEQEAMDIAKLAARRDFENTEIADACLCHGAAGVAHVFNRMFQTTGETWLKRAALAFFDRTFTYYDEQEGVGGFMTRYRDGTHDWEPEPGFFMGAAGIGLSLLAAVSDASPDWDRLLLCS